MDVPVLFEDDQLLVVLKPAGILVHRSEATSRREPALLQMLRDRLGQHVYPVHRLDRPTSGLLLFAKQRESASILGKIWADRLCEKTYLGIVRGWAPDQLSIDHPLRDLDDPEAPAQEAVTHLLNLARVELDAAVDRYPKARYSLSQMQLETGRRHQLRRHCKAIFHPLIGDTVYGQGAHNRFFRERYDCPQLLLHHARLEFEHPWEGRRIRFWAEPDAGWQKLLTCFDWQDALKPLRQDAAWVWLSADKPRDRPHD